MTDLDNEMEILRRKKLKLLRDTDWLGLHLQEPVKLKYASIGVDDNIGKRRRLKPGHEARYEKHYIPSSPAHRSYDAVSQVRVAIDGKESRVGVSSSAAPQSHGRAPPPLSSQSSEPMLLEERLGSEASYVASGQSESRQQAHHRFGSHRSNQRAQNAYNEAPLEHEKEAPPRRENLSLLVTAPIKQRRLYETAPSFSSSSIRKRAEELGCAPDGDSSGDNFKSPFLSLPSSGHHSSQELPALPRPVSPAPQRNSDDARKKARLIMPSSPPVLHHPVPRRATSKVLRTNSIEIASSVAATVGEVPKQTETAKKEDDMWKNWLDEDAADGSDPGLGLDETDKEQDNQRSISPGVSQYVLGQSPVQEYERSSTPGVSECVPLRFTAEISENLQRSRSSEPSVEPVASGAESNGTLAHNAMRMSSSVNSTAMLESRTPSARARAAPCIGQAAAAIASSVLDGSPCAESRRRISIPLPNIRETNRFDDETAWKAFLQSPSELRFDAESPRPFQKPPVRRPKQEKLKPKTPDPDAAWKSFVLTDYSDSEGENPAFNSFWKKNEMQSTPPQSRIPPQIHTSSSHASLEVHAPTSLGRPGLRFSGPEARTPAKLKSRAPSLSRGTSNHFNYTQMLGGRSMYANQSQISSIEDPESQILDVRSMYANQSHESMTATSLSSRSGPFTPNKSTGQTMRGGFFKPAPKLRAKAPLGSRGQETLKRPVPLVTPQKARNESFVDGLDKKYVQQANRELTKELWKKKANGKVRGDRGDMKAKGRERQTESIWDIPSSDDDYIEDS